MNSVAFYFVSGDSFFFGIAVLLVICLLAMITKRILPRSLLRIFTIVAALLIWLSSTPLPLWFYLLWGAPIFLFLCDWQQSVKVYRRCIPIVPPIIILFSLGAGILEFPYHIKPAIVLDGVNRITVIGDSISAGIGYEKEMWPSMLADRVKIPVSNFSMPGLTTGEAIKFAQRLPQGQVNDSAVIVEIGGNDLLGKSDSRIFEQDLDQLLNLASESSNKVMVMELPLPPFCNRFGKIQRKLAKKYNANLIPKRYFAKVLAHPGATVDDIHLSPLGHAMMAETIAGFFSNSPDAPKKEQGSDVTLH